MSFYYKIFFAILAVMVCETCFGQQTEKNEIAPYRPRYISLPLAEKTHTPSFPISDIEVFDVRFDTSNMGLLQGSSLGKDKLLRFKKGCCNEVSEYFKSGILLTPSENNDKGIILACFIKRLFISDNIYIDAGQKVTADNPNFEIKSGVMAVLEFYARQGENFIPLYRFDSTATGKKDIYISGKEYISDILSASLRKLTLINWSKMSTGSKPKSLSEIEGYYKARLNLPIINETPKRGIYFSFDNFKKNTPVDTAFTVDKTTRGDFLYVKNLKGEDILQTELWGYSDGKNMYIFSAENYFQLYRHENTFLVYGAKDFTTVRKLRLNFSMLDMAMANTNYSKSRTTNSYKLEFNLLQLDMESGELY